MGRRGGADSCGCRRSQGFRMITNDSSLEYQALGQEQ